MSHTERFNDASIKQVIWRAGLIESSPAIRGDIDYAVASLIHLAGTLATRTGADYDAPFDNLVRDLELRLHNFETQAHRIIELVAALRDLLDVTDKTYDNRHEWEAARAAISLATEEA